MPEGVEVVGIRDGFEWLMRGDISHVMPLTTAEVTPVARLREACEYLIKTELLPFELDVL